MLKIYDCSNSPERPKHRGSGGPVENGIVTMLKKYAESFNATFVYDPKRCDILFTNDVFPIALLKLNVPKIKRMDGVFWQSTLRERNEPYNAAARQATHVIFISEYSRQSYHDLCGDNLLDHSVILNWVDEQIFYPSLQQSTVIAATATSWSRPEKRFNDICFLARERPYIPFIMIGAKPEGTFPTNMTFTGYLTQEQIACTLRSAGGFVNLSYRDAAPKAVAEAKACGLPVLYTSGGGTHELTEPEDISVGDRSPKKDEIPPLDHAFLLEKFDCFTNNLLTTRKMAFKHAVVCRGKRCQKMLNDYFKILKIMRKL